MNIKTKKNNFSFSQKHKKTKVKEIYGNSVSIGRQELLRIPYKMLGASKTNLRKLEEIVLDALEF